MQETPESKGGYTGFRYASGWQVPVVNADVNARDFYAQHIATRKPALIDGILEDDDFHADRWTVEYLKAHAGDSMVHVERPSDKGHFGTGQQKVIMSFAELLERVTERKEQAWYLTTQVPVELFSGNADAAPPPLCAAPLDHVMEDLPQQPRLLGNLIPHQMNLWLGNSREGTSSGLHHDFHDNLYILLRGRKCFRLFSPADASKLYTHGAIARVHPNGVINYPGHPTRADGAHPVEVAQAALSRAEAALAALPTGATEEEREEAEQRVEDALEAVLNAGTHAHGSKRRRKGAPVAAEQFEDAEDADEEEQEEEEEEDGFDDFDGSVDLRDDFELEEDMMGSSDDDDHEEEEEEKGGKEKEVQQVPHKQKGSQAMQERRSEKTKGEREEARTEPDSFSRIPIEVLRGRGQSQSDAQQQPQLSGGKGQGKNQSVRRPRSAEFPLLDDAVETVVEVRAGQMLYLPAGWFHEVTSRNDEENAADVVGAAGAGTGSGVGAGAGDSSNSDVGGGGGGGWHMALNYWMHPPDGPSFDKPYTDSHWQLHHAARAQGRLGQGQGSSVAGDAAEASGGAVLSKGKKRLDEDSPATTTAATATTVQSSKASEHKKRKKH